MEDELSEKMHSEFTISPETEKLHNIWGLINDMSVGIPLTYAITGIDVTMDEVINYLPEYNRLFSKNVILKI